MAFMYTHGIGGRADQDYANECLARAQAQTKVINEAFEMLLAEQVLYNAKQALGILDDGQAAIGLVDLKAEPGHDNDLVFQLENADIMDIME